MSEITFPGVVKQGDGGLPVKQVQEWLGFHRIHTEIDSDFGPATARAVAQFQAARGFAATGVVDVYTWEELIAPMKRAMTPMAFPAGTPISHAVLQTARQQLREHPIELGGPNRGPWVRFYMDGRDGPDQLWCAGFVTFLLRQACQALGVPMPIRGSHGCDELANQARRAGRFVAGPTVDWDGLGSCQVFLLKKTPNDYFHTGLAFSGSAGTFSTIEGNTDRGGSSNGIEVEQRVRTTRNADFIRLD